jgi:hypothetical protein
MTTTRTLSLWLLAAACLPDEPDQGVGYRDGSDGGPTSGERGTVKITEILWSGSVAEDGTWDVTDQFIELRNEGARAVNLSGWRLDLSGVADAEWRIPTSDFILEVGQQAIIATKSTGCFPNATWVLPQLKLPFGDRFALTLKDADERLMEGAGDRDQPPFVGGYDLVSSRSMERTQLIFGGDGNRSQSWHYYNLKACAAGVIGDDPERRGLSCFEAIPNNDLMAPGCREHTLASPGRPNSPDYSGAFANGSFE